MRNTTLKALRETTGKIVAEFYSPGCGACLAVERKLEALEEKFPTWNFLRVNTLENPEVAGDYSVFTVPTILVFLDGKELNRWSRNFSIDEIEVYLERLGPSLR